MQVWYLDQTDALEEVMATHSSILAWRILIDRGAWCATVHRVIKSGTWLKVTWHTCTPYICVVLHYKKLISFWQSLRRKYIKIYTEINISRVAQRIKSLPAIQETWVLSLGREDSLEKGVATHSSILAWRIPRTVEPGRLQSMGSHRVGHDWATHNT